MIDPQHFRDRVIRPTLDYLGIWSQAAENLLTGTALVESNLSALVQNGGPALGVYQVEPATHDDLLINYLVGRQSDLYRRARELAGGIPPGAPVTEQLVVNLAYATAIARLVYWRRPEPLPFAEDIEGLAHYWKAHYNTRLGAGDPAEFVHRYIDRT